ncbi:MAG: phosphoribosylformylglycinamidine synthase subunit PurS [Nitrospinota bacterium]
MKSKVIVSLKKGILDPQGKAVEHSLNSLGFGAVRGVRIGKFIEIDMEQMENGEAEKLTEEMCKKLLSNPVTENYEIRINSKGE